MIQSRATTKAPKLANAPSALAQAELTAAELDVHVGQRMRLRREALGVTQTRLARHLGVTFSQVQKYEKGSNRIGAGRLFLVAAYLGVPVRYFFESLGDRQAPCSEAAPRLATSAELALLEEAFRAIGDPETRGSVVALVRSLAGSSDLAAKPRRITA